MRYQYLDILRWFAIVLMILFHLNYSLVYIFDSNILNFSEIFWFILWKISALWFITIAWASFYLASEKYTQTELTEKYVKYALVLAVCSGAITLGTAVFFPSQLILFGILHFFAVSFAILPFIARSKSLAIFIIILIWSIYLAVPQVVDTKVLFPFGFIPLGFYSADYYPLLPYFLVILLWYLWAEFLSKNKLLQYFHISRDLNKIEKTLSFIGKRSIMIYLIHQPIIILLLILIF